MKPLRSMIHAAVFLALCTGSVSGQSVPAWFKALPDNPDQVTGRGSAELGAGGEAAALAMAKKEAMRDLAASLMCRLTSEIIDRQTDNGSAGAESHFASRTTIESALDLVNVQTIHETVTRNMAFVAVAANRAEMARIYQERTARHFTLANQAFQRGVELEKEKNAHSALAAYAESLGLMRDAQDALQAYLAINRWKDDLTSVTVRPDEAEIRLRLQKLAATTPRTLTQIAGTLASGLTASLPAKGAVLQWAVPPVEFENTGFVSDFGYRLTEALAADLAKHPGIRITDDFSRADAILRLRMIREGDGLLLIARTGDLAARHFVEPVTCQAIGRDRVEPPDLERLLMDKLALHKAMSAPEGLRVELRTDRLHAGPVTYRFGDQPKLAVRADRACFIRLIYTGADGKRLLLMDRHPIGEHQANQWVRLPLELEVCPPAGVEQLILQAITQEDDMRLPPLKVKNVPMGDNYVMPIIQDSLDEAMTRTRGVMVKKKYHFAEVVSHWTVFPAEMK